jgi:hypothetical protein
MLRFWVLPVVGSIAVLGLACRANGDDLPTAVGTATPTASRTATASPAPTAIVSPNPTVPADWATFASPDGLFEVRYPSGWFAKTIPTPAPGSGGYEAGILFSTDPSKVGPTPPPMAASVDLDVSLPTVQDCRVQPTNATPATMGGIPGWRVMTTQPNDFGQTSDGFSAYHAGLCFLVTGYFGPQSQDQSTFQQIVASLVFIGSTR